MVVRRDTVLLHMAMGSSLLSLLLMLVAEASRPALGL